MHLVESETFGCFILNWWLFKKSPSHQHHTQDEDAKDAEDEESLRKN